MSERSTTVFMEMKIKVNNGIMCPLWILIPFEIVLKLGWTLPKKKTVSRNINPWGNGGIQYFLFFKRIQKLIHINIFVRRFFQKKVKIIWFRGGGLFSPKIDFFPLNTSTRPNTGLYVVLSFKKVSLDFPDTFWTSLNQYLNISYWVQKKSVRGGFSPPPPDDVTRGADCHLLTF